MTSPLAPRRHTACTEAAAGNRGGRVGCHEVLMVGKFSEESTEKSSNVWESIVTSCGRPDRHLHPRRRQRENSLNPFHAPNIQRMSRSVEWVPRSLRKHTSTKRSPAGRSLNPLGARRRSTGAFDLSRSDVANTVRDRSRLQGQREEPRHGSYWRTGPLHQHGQTGDPAHTQWRRGGIPANSTEPPVCPLTTNNI